MKPVVARLKASAATVVAKTYQASPCFRRSVTAVSLVAGTRSGDLVCHSGQEACDRTQAESGKRAAEFRAGESSGFSDQEGKEGHRHLVSRLDRSMCRLCALQLLNHVDGDGQDRDQDRQ